MMILQTPEGIELNPLEQKAQEYANEWAVTGRGYSMEQATRPSTIGLVLSSSPLALLAWQVPLFVTDRIPTHLTPFRIGEKFIEWSDETPSLDHILTNITLYWYVPRRRKAHSLHEPISASETDFGQSSFKRA